MADKCPLIEELVALTARKARRRYCKPAKSKLRRWLDFCKEIGISGRMVSAEGAFFPWISRGKIEIVMELYTTYLTEKRKTPPSTIEGYYSAALIPSKREGIEVAGLQAARGWVDRHKKKHVQRKKTTLEMEDIRNIYHALSNYVFGEEGRRKSVQEVNKSDAILYFLVVTSTLLAIRNASLVPVLVKSETFKAYLIWWRDVEFDHKRKLVKIQVFEKPDRLRGSLTPRVKTFPKIENIKGAFLGPYRAACVLEGMLTNAEKKQYLRKDIWRGTRRSNIVQSDLTAWLQRVARKTGILERLKTRVPRDYSLTCQRLRRQAMTAFEQIAATPNELQKLSGHSRASTTLNHYVGVTSDREQTLKRNLGAFYCTGLSVYFYGGIIVD